MASFQKTLNLDVLNVKAIVPKAANNATIPQYAVLTADSNGGTTWTSTFVGDGRRVQFVTAVALSTNTNYTIESGAFTAGSFIGDGSRVANVIATGLSTGVDYQIGSGSFNASTMTAHYFYGDGSQLLNVVGDGLRVGSNYNIGDGSFAASTFTAETFIGNTFSGIAQSASNAGITSNLVYSNTYYVSSLNINQTINPPVIPTMVTPQPDINLYVHGGTYLNGPTFMLSNTWQYDTNGNQRILYGVQNPGFDTTFGSPDGFVWNNYKANLDPTEVMRLTSTGVLNVESLVKVPSLEVTTIQSPPFPYSAATFAEVLIRPCGIAIDSSGTFYVINNTGSLYKITSGGSVSLFTTGLNGVYSLTVDVSGNIYAAELIAPPSFPPSTPKIYSITPLGVKTLLAGGGTHTVGTNSGPGFIGTNAKFENINGICLDISGNIYVCDKPNYVYKINISTKVISLITNTISEPYAITIDQANILYVTNTNGMKIYSINQIGPVVRTIAGNGIGYGDGIGTNAQFNRPQGITIDSSGVLFISDSINNKIRKIDSSDSVTTIVGGGATGVISGNINGIGTNALFYAPWGIVSVNGSLFVADSGNNLVRKININSTSLLLNPNYGFVGIGCNAPQYTLDVNGNANISGNINTATGSISSLRVSSLTAGLSQVSIERVSSLTVSSMLTADASISTLRVSSLTAGSSQVSIGRVSSLTVSSMLTADASISSLRVSSLTVGTSQVSIGRVSSLTVSSMLTATGSISSLNVSSFTAGTIVVPTVSITNYTGVNITVDNILTKTLVATTFTTSTMSASTISVSSLQAGLSQVSIERVSSLTVSSMAVFDGSISTLRVSSLTAGTSQISIETVSSLTVSSMLNADASISTLRVSSLIARTSQISIETVSSLTVSSMAVFDGSISTLRVSSLTAGTSQVSIETVSSLTVSSMLTADASISSLRVSSLIARISQISIETVSSLTVSSMVVFNGSISNLQVRSLIADVSQTSNAYISSITSGLIIGSNSKVFIYGNSSIPSNIVSTLAGGTSSGFQDGNGTNAGFNQLNGLDVDSNGNIYVADTFNHLIRKIYPGGQVTTIAGGTSSGFQNGNGTNARFNRPTDITVDSLGNLYVTDDGNYAIRKIYPGGEVSTLAGSIGTGFVDGNGTNAKFNTMYAIRVDKFGNLYVVDQGYFVIRKVDPNGVVSTIAGRSPTIFDPNTYINGYGTSAYIPSLRKIAIDVSGNLFFTTRIGNTIQKYDASTQFVSLIAGGVYEGQQNGYGTNAGFYDPRGIAIDMFGNIFVCEYLNQFIRKIDTNFLVTTISGNGNASFMNGNGTNALFKNPQGMAIDTNGNLYVADSGNNMVRKIQNTFQSTFISTINTLIVNASIGVNCNAPQYSLDVNGNANISGNINAATGSISTLRVSSFTTGLSYVTLQSVSSSAVSSMAVADASISTLRVSSLTAGTSQTSIEKVSSLTVSSMTVATGSILSLTTSSFTTTTILDNGTTVKVVNTLAGNTIPGTANGQGTNATFSNPDSVAVAANGTIYVADTLNNMIRSITPSGLVQTFAGNPTAGTNGGQGTNAQFSSPIALTVDASGNVYVADSANNQIRAITTGGLVTTLAGGTSAGFVNDVGTKALFSLPAGIVACTNGNLYVSDGNNNVIRAISLTTKQVTTLAGGTSAGFVNDYGTNARFNTPRGITVNSAGDTVYVGDRDNSCIRKITVSNSNVTTLAGGSSAGYLDGVGTNALFKNVRGIGIDTLGNIYVADHGNASIRLIDTASNVTTLAGNGIRGSLNSVGPSATFYAPWGVAVGPNKVVYVADQANNMIRAITDQNVVNLSAAVGINCNVPQYNLDVNGTINGVAATFSNMNTLNATISSLSVSTLVGYTSGGSTFSTLYVSSSITTNQILATTTIPYALTSTIQIGTNNSDVRGAPKLAIDASGNFYMTDSPNHRIVKISRTGLYTIIAGGGSGGTQAGSVDGTGTNARFQYPIGIAIDQSGTLYVADYENSKIRRITLSGLVTTVAGGGSSGTNFGFQDGIGTYALFNYPHTVAIDVYGNIFVADTSNGAIRKITSGVVTTIAGNGSFGFQDGIGTNAMLAGPYSVTVDSYGTLYVADIYNSAIRKILKNGTVTTLATGIIAPEDVAVDGNCVVYVAAAADSIIYKITPDSNVTVLAGNTNNPSSIDLDGIGTNALFSGAWGVTLDTSGTLYINEYSVTSTIRTININTNPLLINPSYGNVGINTVNPNFTLDVNGTINASGSMNVGEVLSVNGSIGVNCNAPQYTLDVNGTINGIAGTFSTLYTSSLSGNEIISNPQLLPYGFTSTINITQYNFPVIPTMALPTVKGIAVDSYGTLYIADQEIPVITTISTNGVASILANTVTGGQHIVLYNGFAYYANSGSARIDKINLTTGLVTVFAGSPTGIGGFTNAVGTNALFNYPCQMAFDVTYNNLYVAEYANNQIRKINLTTSNVTTFAGGGGANNSGLYLGQGTNALFLQSGEGITVDSSGNVFYVMGYSILKITSAGIPSIFAGNPTFSGYKDGIGTYALFSGPIHLSIDPNNNIYVSEVLRVRMITPAGVVTTVAGGGDQGTLLGYVDGVGGNAALFGGLWAILYNKYDNLLYVGDFGNNTIRTIQTQNTVPPVTNPLLLNPLSGNVGINTTNPQYTLDVNGNANFNGNVWANSFNDSITPVQSNIPVLTTYDTGSVSSRAASGWDHLLLAPNGTIYTTNTTSNCIYRTIDKVTTLYAGSPTGASGSANGLGTNATFADPGGLAIDSSGSKLYVADVTNNKICVINLTTSYVSTLAGSGSSGYADGTGILATFTNPRGLAITSDNSQLYIGDQDKIRKINLATTYVSTVAGQVTSGSTDGIGINAKFSTIYDIAIDQTSANLYMTDFNNNAIRRMNLATTSVTTVAGKSGFINTYVDAVGVNARFNNPYNLVFDSGYRNLYISDYNNNAIRKLDVATSNVTTYYTWSNTTSTKIPGISSITGLDIDTNNTIYFVTANTNNSNISVLTPTLSNYLQINGICIASNGFALTSGQITGAYDTEYVSPYGIGIASKKLPNGYASAPLQINWFWGIAFGACQNGSGGGPMNPSTMVMLNNTVGINCNAPAYALDVNGTIHASGDIIAFSDQRVKTNIVQIETPLGKISSLTGVYYNRCDGLDMSTVHMGLIAQDVEKVLPEVVKTDSSEEKKKSVAYGNIVAVLIEGIKELTQRLAPLETLSTQVSVLQSQNIYLQSTIASIIR